jgi:hypothetical protein
MGRRNVATGGAALKAQPSPRNPWFTIHTFSPLRGEGTVDDAAGSGTPLVLHRGDHSSAPSGAGSSFAIHGFRSAPPVAIFRGPIRGQSRKDPDSAYAARKFLDTFGANGDGRTSTLPRSTAQSGVRRWPAVAVGSGLNEKGPSQRSRFTIHDQRSTTYAASGQRQRKMLSLALNRTYQPASYVFQRNEAV